jgi:poly(3-hydroxybutyrate) depolymerase
VLDRDRSFLLYLPPDPEGAPLLLLWHWLGGSASSAAQTFSAQQVANERGWIVAVPDSCCSSQTEWGYPPATQATEQDLTFFDDLLGCVGGQYEIDTTRIYTSGMSAGGLWSSYLVLERSQYLAGAAIFSGGIGLFPYETPDSRMPVLLVDGGPTDIFGRVVNFHTMTEEFATRLTEDGHFVVHCVHTSGHTIPQGANAWGFNFLASHDYAQMDSPLSGSDLGDGGYPNWCEIR